MTKRNCLVFFLITALIFTMCSVSVFAEDEVVPDSALSTEASDTAEDAVTDDTATDDTAADDNSTADDESEAGDTDATGSAATDGKEEHDHEDEDTDKNGLSTTAIVLLAVFGAIILIFAVLYLFKPKFRERVKKFFREYKSELKKVVWSSKADVIKNTKIVIIGIVAIAVVVGLVDIGLANLIDLIGKIGK